MDPYILYYTFSTIPQVIAGAIALLGVFWVYQADKYNTRMVKRGDLVYNELQKRAYQRKINSIPNSKNIHNIIGEFESNVKTRNYKRIKENLISIRDNRDLKTGKFIANSVGIFDHYWQKKQKLSKNTRTSLVSSAVLLFVSVGLIPFTEVIHGCICASILSLVIVILFFGVSVCLISKTVYLTLSRD